MVRRIAGRHRGRSEDRRFECRYGSAYGSVRLGLVEMLPSPDLSKSQLDRLGDRLRKGEIRQEDQRLLDSYRRSFSDSYEVVFRRIRNELGLEPTGRPQKTATSIIEKLRRQSIRLSQIQDIAGCRIVVPDLVSQDEIVERLKTLFAHADVDDRRDQPSHGY